MSEMKTIWKYPMSTAITHEMPEGAKFLTFRLQDQDYQAWFEVDPGAKLVPRKFHMVGTGWTFHSGIYLGTVEVGPFIWHLYENMELHP